MSRCVYFSDKEDELACSKMGDESGKAQKRLCSWHTSTTREGQISTLSFIPLQKVVCCSLEIRRKHKNCVKKIKKVREE